MSPDYLIAAYAISFATILGYFLWLSRRERVLEEELQYVIADDDDESPQVRG